MAWVDAAGRLNVWSQCQLAHLARRELAAIFNMPVRKVRVLTPFIGGSFGQRGALRREPIAAALALKTNGRCGWCSRAKRTSSPWRAARASTASTSRHGFNQDGTLTAIKTDMVGKLGGYMGCGPMASVIGMALVMGHYRCPTATGPRTWC